MHCLRHLACGLPRWPHMAVENSIWWLALLFSMVPAGRVMAAVGQRHHILHARSHGSRLQSSSALLEARSCWAPSYVASWAITASPHDDAHGPGRPPGERARAVRLVWCAWAKHQAKRHASSTVVKHGRMRSMRGQHSLCAPPKPGSACGMKTAVAEWLELTTMQQDACDV